MQDKIINELINDEKNVKKYVAALKDVRDSNNVTKEQMKIYFKNNQDIIRREAKKIHYKTIVNSEYDSTKYYDEDEIEDFFYKSFNEYYIAFELIMLDYFKKII